MPNPVFRRFLWFSQIHPTEAIMVPETVATLGHVRGRGPLDTSSAKQDEEDSGRDEAGNAGGSRPAPRYLRSEN